MKLSPTEIYRDRKIFMIGSTGFLGQSHAQHVAASLSGHRPRLRHRARAFAGRIGNALLEQRDHGAAFRSVARDATAALLKVSFATRWSLWAAISVKRISATAKSKPSKSLMTSTLFINTAGNVTFNPTLESALRTNVVGTQNVIAFAKRMKRPALIHVSTCFVAGNRSGPVWENDPVVGYFPRKDELKGVEFSVEEEISDCAKLADRVREEARDAMMVAHFRELARKRLNEEGRDADDPDALGLAVARERKVWTRTRLTELGVERAAFWGWPNIYTYTKSLGEQLVAAETGIVRSIVRPSIVESAQSIRFPVGTKALPPPRRSSFWC